MPPLLQQPYLPPSEFRTCAKQALIVSLGVTFMLTVLQPFDINEIEGSLRWRTGLYFGAVTCGTMIFNYVWIWAFPRVFSEEEWTLGRHLLWISYNFVTISFGNFLLGSYLFPLSGIFASYGPVLFVTIIVGLFPTLLMIYIGYSRHLRRNLQTALTLNRQLLERDQQAPPPEPTTRLPLADEEELLPPIALDQLLYVEAEGNYLRLWVLQHGQPTDYRMRATLKQQTEQWAEHPQLFRSHRAFLVNLGQVKQVEGNSAGYRLTLHPSLPQVPVSRGQAQAFKAAFQEFMAVA